MKHLTFFLAIIVLTLTTGCCSVNSTHGNRKPIEFENFRLEIDNFSPINEVYVGQKTDTGLHLEHLNVWNDWNDSIGDYVETIDKKESVDGDQQLYARVCSLFGECKIRQWNGFDGENPPDVYDGIMMKFETHLSDGSIVKARGMNNFPNHYFEFYQGISTIIKEAANTNNPKKEN